MRSLKGSPGRGCRPLGVKALFEMEELSVMGITEVLGRLPRILQQVRRELLRHFIANPPTSSSVWMHRISISGWS